MDIKQWDFDHLRDRMVIEHRLAVCYTPVPVEHLWGPGSYLKGDM